MPIKPTKRLEISAGRLKALQNRIEGRSLEDSDWEMLRAMTEAVECLSRIIEEKETSIGRLCKYLLGAPTETAKNVIKGREQPAGRQPPIKKKMKGHGRKPASVYAGGEKIKIEHPTLKTGDTCLACEKGRVYELALPSVFVHIKGEAPLKATVYERTRLRCNLCGEIYTPELPGEVGGNKHDESAAAILAVLKYGCGMPLYRLEKLQANLGNPVAASTQWDILNAAAITLAPLYDAYAECAAQGEIVHNDDTTMKILSFLEQQETENSRKGIYTTGIVSKWHDHRIALFMTGRRHAGENLTDILKLRATGLSPPIQMCDAASRNASKDFETIMANCLAHARRQFVELVDRFPDECAHVIEQLGLVYHHDAIAKDRDLSPQQRLEYHRQHSASIMADLQSWCKSRLDDQIVEPNSGLGKAFTYLLNHWEKLTRFLHVPGAPLDNNLCEQALKHAILHRKNALFYKTQRGARVGDLFMSFIHTSQLSGANPMDYLTWLLKNAPQLQKDPHKYMPWNFIQSEP